jgi:hypothetical protein
VKLCSFSYGVVCYGIFVLSGGEVSAAVPAAKE